MWWQASVEWTATCTRSPEDFADDILDELARHHAGVLSFRDTNRFGTTLSVDASTLRQATALATQVVVAAASNAGHRNIVPMEVAVVDEPTGHARLEEPLYPELLGYSQIARLAGVSRQRVRQLAKDHPRFPVAFLSTEYGPLFQKGAVMHFLEHTRWTGRRMAAPWRGGSNATM